MTVFKISDPFGNQLASPASSKIIENSQYFLLDVDLASTKCLAILVLARFSSSIIAPVLGDSSDSATSDFENDTSIALNPLPISGLKHFSEC